MTTIKPWRHLSTRRLAATPIFGLDVHRRASAETGREGDFYVLDAPNWVNVVAVTDDRRVVLVEQYRQGVERTTIEIPGGMVDPDDASPEAAARRELLEETGFASDRWLHIGTVDPNPAIQSNRCFTFLADSARRISEPTPDGNEEIRVLVEPEDRIPDLVREGRIEHALVVAAFYWWTLARESEATRRDRRGRRPGQRPRR
jgi:8-oxo-dGTP pyrophosphatase MutT (NUDIX family)